MTSTSTDKGTPAVTPAPGAAPEGTKLRYKCLIIDHDDTAVDSSATVHHPAHVKSMVC